MSEAEIKIGCRMRFDGMTHLKPGTRWRPTARLGRTMSDGQRDQWGETAEERHARILARDLAWMTYAEACARDGVPRSERDHLIFNDGYAAGRADYLHTDRTICDHGAYYVNDAGTRVCLVCRHTGRTNGSGHVRGCRAEDGFRCICPVRTMDTDEETR